MFSNVKLHILGLLVVMILLSTLSSSELLLHLPDLLSCLLNDIRFRVPYDYEATILFDGFYETYKINRHAYGKRLYRY